VGGTKIVGGSRVTSTVPLTKVAKATTVLVPTITNTNNKSTNKTIILSISFYYFLSIF